MVGKFVKLYHIILKRAFYLTWNKRYIKWTANIGS